MPIALGMESRTIQDGQLTASSSLDLSHSAASARFNIGTGWCAGVNDLLQYLQIDLLSAVIVTKVEFRSLLYFFNTKKNKHSLAQENKMRIRSKLRLLSRLTEQSIASCNVIRDSLGLRILRVKHLKGLHSFQKPVLRANLIFYLPINRKFFLGCFLKK